jgi:hypothetical protein
MKILKIATLNLLVLVGAATLNAQSSFYITGSTAYRLQANNTILAMYDAVPAVQYGFTGATLAGANQVIFVGNIGGVAINTFTSWTGSEAGIQSVAGAAITANFLPANTPVSTGGTGGAAAGTDPHHPDACMSDTFQSSSQFKNVFRGVTYAALSEASGTTAGHGSPVGVVAFKWCARNGSTITNMTSQLARALYPSGKLPLALFTGNNADETKPVVALGRNPDSGTRLTSFAETGLGALSAVHQYQPRNSAGVTVNTTTGTISQFQPWPAETINGVPVAAFNSGYSSGGDLSKAMAATVTDPVTIGATSYPGSNVTFVGYLGTGDADSNLLNAGNPRIGVELSYNGVLLGNVGGDYGTVPALIEGRYTFWGYEHLLYNTATIGVDQKSAADTLATHLFDGGSQILLSNMRVQRTSDGTTVSNSYATP